MDTLLVEVAKQVPALTVLAFIVWAFIRFLAQASSAMQDIHRECHSTQERATVALERNTDALDRLGGQMEEMTRYTNGGAR